MPRALPILPSLSDQADRLIELGAHQIGSLSAAELRAAAMGAEPRNALLVLHRDCAPASALASLLEHSGKRGFVVADMTDVDQFSPIESAVLPAGPLYLVADLHRGDEMANCSPDEALPTSVKGASPWVFCGSAPKDTA